MSNIIIWRQIKSVMVVCDSGISLYTVSIYQVGHTSTVSDLSDTTNTWHCNSVTSSSRWFGYLESGHIFVLTLCCPNGNFFSWEIPVAFPKQSELQQSRYPNRYKVHAWSFRVSVTRRTLTWTKGYFTWSFLCVRIHTGIGHIDNESA